MSAPRSGWYVTMGDEDRLVVVRSEVGLPPPALRFRTPKNAFAIAEELNGDRVRSRVRRDFGGEVTA